MPDEESMIQDLRELEEELRQQGEYRKANIIDLFIRYSTHCKIDRSDIVKKIEELKLIINKYEKQIENDEETDLSYEEIRNYACKMQVLQELLEKRK